MDPKRKHRKKPLKRSSELFKSFHRLPTKFVRDCGFIPVVLINTAAVVERCIKTKGIFQTQGTSSKALTTMNQLSSGRLHRQSRQLTVHDAVEAMKLVLVSLPEPLIPEDVCDSLITASRENSVDQYDKILARFRMKSPLNFGILHFMMILLWKVSHHTQYNLMDVRKLATIFVLDVIKPLKLDDPSDGEFLSARMQRLPYLIMVVEKLIRHVEIFKTARLKRAETPEPETPRKAGSGDSICIGGAQTNLNDSKPLARDPSTFSSHNGNLMTQFEKYERYRTWKLASSKPTDERNGSIFLSDRSAPNIRLSGSSSLEDSTLSLFNLSLSQDKSLAQEWHSTSGKNSHILPPLPSSQSQTMLAYAQQQPNSAAPPAMKRTTGLDASEPQRVRAKLDHKAKPPLLDSTVSSNMSDRTVLKNTVEATLDTSRHSKSNKSPVREAGKKRQGQGRKTRVRAGSLPSSIRSRLSSTIATTFSNECASSSVPTNLEWHGTSPKRKRLLFRRKSDSFKAIGQKKLALSSKSPEKRRAGSEKPCRGSCGAAMVSGRLSSFSKRKRKCSAGKRKSGDSVSSSRATAIPMLTVVSRGSEKMSFLPDEVISPWVDEGVASDDTSLMSRNIRNPRVLATVTSNVQSVEVTNKSPTKSQRRGRYHRQQRLVGKGEPHSASTTAILDPSEYKSSSNALPTSSPFRVIDPSSTSIFSGGSGFFTLPSSRSDSHTDTIGDFSPSKQSVLTSVTSSPLSDLSQTNFLYGEEIGKAYVNEEEKIIVPPCTKSSSIVTTVDTRLQNGVYEGVIGRVSSTTKIPSANSAAPTAESDSTQDAVSDGASRHSFMATETTSESLNSSQRQQQRVEHKTNSWTAIGKSESSQVHVSTSTRTPSRPHVNTSSQQHQAQLKYINRHQQQMCRMRLKHHLRQHMARQQRIIGWGEDVASVKSREKAHRRGWFIRSLLVVFAVAISFAVFWLYKEGSVTLALAWQNS